MSRTTTRRTRAKPAKPSAPAAPPPPAQFELFPERVLIEVLDAQRVGGARTRVRGVWRVHFGSEAKAHRVWHDRHGWYCEEHGPHCRAVPAVRPES